MARTTNDVSRIVCTNTIQENEKRLLEARIKNQGKGRPWQDLNKLLGKLNQAVEANSVKTSEKLSPSCYNRSVTSCRYGPVLGFPPGSWWGILMDCSRDGMHEPFDTDIHEGPFGVISVCTSHANVNEDLDLGDFLTLTGQVYREEQPNADPFILNYKNQIPLRLIRSYNLQDDIAPNTGYRYDGLYTVIGCWIGAALDGTKYNKFALMRLADQESSSWDDKSLEDPSSARRCVPLTRSSCPNTYDLRKCSYNTGGDCRKRKLSDRHNSEDQPILRTIENGKNCVPESSIVTRHVFKKLPNNAENTISTSIPEQKTLMCLGASATKTHSTNISIRMGLYESSLNAQNAKKNISTMLKKPSKPIDVTVRTTLDIESVHLTPKEDGKLIERIDADKARIDPRPNENVSCNGRIAIDNTIDVACPSNKRRRTISPEVVYSSEPSNFVTPLVNRHDDTNAVESKEQFPDARQYSDAQNSDANGSIQQLSSSNEPLRNSIAKSNGKIPKQHRDITEIPSESLREQGIKSLDSLTPDKILNLINKEKHHPLSKLLIENIIGLTTERYATLDTSEMRTASSKNKAHMSQKINLKKRRKGGDNIKENVACLDNRRYCKYSKSERLSWKMTKQSDAGKFDKLMPNVDHRQSCNDANRKRNGNARRSDRSGVPKKSSEYLSPFRVQTSLQTIAQHTRSSYDIKTRLRTDKSAALLSKQKFANSSMKKTKYKKRDREIANLSIDANFSPVTRGPRNRRLRCRNDTYTNKKCYSTFNTAMYPPSKRHKSSFKRKSKPTKVNRQLSADGQTKNGYRVSSTLRTDDKDIDDSIEERGDFKDTGNMDKNGDSNTGDRKGNGTVTAEVDDRGVSKASFDRGLRKKLTRTISSSHRAAQTPRLHYFHKKQVEKPSTMDATTQCRLISENSEVYVIGQLNNHRAVLKMEWNKLEKLKLESVRDDRGSEIHRTSRLCAASSFTEDDESVEGDEGRCADLSQDRASAFVPVNAFDSDLRIARLRSIGFKPIIKPRSPFVAHNSETIPHAVNTNKVTKRDVAQEYDKYANNEDNNVVVYMDDELQYQDIEEEEDDGGALASKKLALEERGAYSRNVGNVLPETLPTRENSESPWHGWKKIVTNNRSYWIGW